MNAFERFVWKPGDLKFLTRVRDAAADWNEEDHPRNEQGEFTFKGQTLAVKHAAMLKKIQKENLETKFANWKYDKDKGVEFAFVANANAEDEAAMHALAAKYDMTLTKYDADTGDDKTTSLWKAEHTPPSPTTFTPPTAKPAPIDVNDLTKIAGKMGSNAGGVYKDAKGNQYYVKLPKTEDHVKNELMAADLYKLAGVNVKEFIPSKDNDAVITKFVDLKKKNISEFTEAEKAEARKDFGVHAWLSNWDAAGTGGDNQVIDANGKVMTVDTGGSMKYRAQGEPKGDAYGYKVTDTQSIIDPKLNKDGAALYGPMTDEEKIAAYQRVIDIPDFAIINTVNNAGGTWTDAEKLVLRKKDLLDQSLALQKKAAAKEDFGVLLEKTDKMSAEADDVDKMFAEAAAISAQWEEKYPIAQPAQSNMGGEHDAFMQAITTQNASSPPPTFKTKAEHFAHLLAKGTTTKEVMSKLEWPTVSMPQQAHNANMKLEKIKGDDGVTYYKGTPMTPQEIATKGKKPAPTYNKKATHAETEAMKAGTAFSPTLAATLAKQDITTQAAHANIPHIMNPTEASTLGKALKNTAPSTIFHPAENKATAPDQQFHSYSVNNEADFTEMKKTLNAAGYQYEEYSGGHIDKFYGVKIKADYAVKPSLAGAASTPTPPPMNKPPGGWDINKPHENFMQTLNQEGVPATMTPGDHNGELGYKINVQGSITLAEQAAKYHPQVQKINNYHYFVPLKQPVPAPVAQKISEAFKAVGVTYATPEPDFTDIPVVTTKGVTYAQPTPTPPPPPPPPVLATPPTEAELTKAKKNAALQLQYVPGAPDVPAAHALIAEFNKKYEGKVLTTEAELTQKIADFNHLKASMVPLMSVQQQEAAAKQAAQQAAHAAAQAKAAKEAAEAAQAAKEAAEAAEAAKMADPNYAAQQAAIKAQYDALHSIGVSAKSNLDANFANKIKKAKAAGASIHLSGADAAYIDAYVHADYKALNKALWDQEKMPLQQSIYAASLQKALDKMPQYAGYAQRGVTTKGAFARYEANLGHVVTEHGFSSYGATHKLWGDEATIHLTAIDLKDIRSFNSGEGGGELILQRGAMLHIVKIDKKTREVWAVQVG